MFLIERIRNILFNFIVSADKVEFILNEKKVKSCVSKVTIGENSKFYEQAIVHNSSNDKSKIRIGKQTHIRSELHLFENGGEIIIGDFCYLGDGTRIWSGEKIVIGNHVFISHNCNVFDTNSHEIDYIERSEMHIYRLNNNLGTNVKGNVETSPIIIEDHVWISFNVIILKGVTIGKGAIIAAGSVVTKDVPPFSVIAGNPGRVIKKIEK